MDIVGIGMATLDVLVRLDEMPTWERGAQIDQFALDGGGPAGTAVVAAAKFGAKTGFISTAGDDEPARIKLASFLEHGVDLSRNVVRPGRERQVIVCYVSEKTGDRRFSGVKGLHEGQLKPEELDRGYITSARFLHLDGFHYEAAYAAAGWMREAGKTVVYDGAETRRSVSDATRRLLERVDILICGAGFAQSLTGMEDRERAIRTALTMGLKTVVQTEGAVGCYSATGEEYFHTPAFQVDVVDTTGAGDVFHGGYLFGMLKGWDARTIARFSTAVSALKCTRLGGRAGIPGYGEVIGFLEQRGFTIDKE